MESKMKKEQLQEMLDRMEYPVELTDTLSQLVELGKMASEILEICNTEECNTSFRVREEGRYQIEVKAEADSDWSQAEAYDRMGNM
jgi:hypothetical protein